jgi:DNA-binding response OmpR family regulator
MNKQKVYTVNSLNLYNILEEIKDYLNFNIEFIDLSKFSRNDFQNNDFQSSLFLVFEKDKFKADKVLDLKNIIYLQDSPISLSKLVEKINIFSLKFNFKSQSKIEVNDYVVDINERKITKNNNELKLTEREIEIILFLNKKETPQNVDSLQTQIWKQKKELETHTVETHIYRLRKKINEKFNDNNFIKSNDVGYFI